VVVVVAGLVAGLVVGTAGLAFDKAGLVVGMGVGACAKADEAANAIVRMSVRVIFMKPIMAKQLPPSQARGRAGTTANREGADNSRSRSRFV
jgi:hypothetical protein